MCIRDSAHRRAHLAALGEVLCERFAHRVERGVAVTVNRVEHPLQSCIGRPDNLW